MHTKIKRKDGKVYKKVCQHMSWYQKIEKEMEEAEQAKKDFLKKWNPKEKEVVRNA